MASSSDHFMFSSICGGNQLFRVMDVTTNHSSLSASESGEQEEKSKLLTLSKNKLRKQRNYQKRLQNRAAKRQKERSKQKSRKNETRRRPHEDEKQLTHKKLLEAQVSGPRVVIDCQFDDSMSQKEQRRFAQQLRRVYSSNKSSPSPLHLYFTSVGETFEFFKICCDINDGFSNYLVDRSEKSFLQLFSDEFDNLIYLTPDAPTPLEAFDSAKIYIIAGLVDETTRKNISYKFTQSNSIKSARLPIEEHFTRGLEGTFKTVLTVNQVFDIILKWYETKDWVASIQAGLPSRAGFISKASRESAFGPSPS